MDQVRLQVIEQAQEITELQAYNSDLHESLCKAEDKVEYLQAQVKDLEEQRAGLEGEVIATVEECNSLRRQVDVAAKHLVSPERTPLSYYLANPRKLQAAIDYMVKEGETLHSDNKIRRIKYVREASKVGVGTCWGIREAKDFVEAWACGTFPQKEPMADLGNYDPTDDMPTDDVPLMLNGDEWLHPASMPSEDYDTDRTYTEYDADDCCVPKG